MQYILSIAMPGPSVQQAEMGAEEWAMDAHQAGRTRLNLLQASGAFRVLGK
jgi:hypothetical protein